MRLVPLATGATLPAMQRIVPDLRDDFLGLPEVPPVWVRSSVVVQVEYRQRLRDGLRHAALKGILPDKRPPQV
jgi:hypothetical protein